MKHHFKRTFYPFFAFSIAFFLIISKTNAATQHVEVRILSQKQGLSAEGKTKLGLELVIEPGWHVYWRNPGDVGLPPKVSLEENTQVEMGELEWPVPEEFFSKSFVSYGYEKQVLIPFDVEVLSGVAIGNAIKLTFDLKWLVCKDSCIPEERKIQIELPVLETSSNKLSDEYDLFEHFLSRVPKNDPSWQLSFTQKGDVLKITATRTAEGSQALLKSLNAPMRPSKHRANHLTQSSEKALKDTKIFVENPRFIHHANPPSIQLSQDRKSLEVLLHLRKKEPISPQTPIGLVLDGPGDWRIRWEIGRTTSGSGKEHRIRPLNRADKMPTSGTERETFLGFLSMLLSAFLGGLILNLMPCVFPVLSIKVLSLIEERKAKKKQVQISGFFYTAGVLVSFWILAGSLMILQKAGHQIGWGFQLQSPYFVSFLIILFFLMGLNLLGVFEVGSSFMGVGSTWITGQKNQKSSGSMEAFMTGVLSVVVASPCTAPFMGVAMGFALSQTIFASLLIFTSLGLGLALPFLMITCFPALARFLPRPGAWMSTLKGVLAFPLFATVAWLVWVLQIQSGGQGLFSTLMALVGLGLAAWIYGVAHGTARAMSYRKLIAAGVLLASVLVLRSGFSGYSGSAKSVESSDRSLGASGKVQENEHPLWEAFSEEKLEQLRSQGVPVFVDYTAAWCITCQVNEKVALQSEAVEARFKELGIATLRADWTNQDPAITQSLQKLGRSGVPLYVLYGRDRSAAPRILPQILTPAVVLEALRGL